MLARFLLTIVVALGFSFQAQATDLASIPRVILKEPAYQGKPRYCLLVFGKDANTRIWLVRDDQSLYMDRHGNGDLTDPGDKITGFHVDQIVERDGTVHKNLQIMNVNNNQFRLRLGNHDVRGQYVGFGLMEKPTWGDKAENAPIIHFNGPLSLERYGSTHTVPRGNGSNRQYSLRLLLGTPGLGKGTFASFDEICSENLGPIQADIVYPAAKRTGASIKQRCELLHDG